MIKNAISVQNSEYVEVHYALDLKGRPIVGGSESPTQ